LTPVAVSPERLKAMSHVMYFETNDAKDIQVASQALSSSKPVLDPEGHIDACWDVLFIGNQSEVLLSVYTSGFGDQGVIDGTAISFTYPAYIEWLEGGFSE
jgi:hypothetical protein